LIKSYQTFLYKTFILKCVRFDDEIEWEMVVKVFIVYLVWGRVDGVAHVREYLTSY
jgi:hypothetical protein